jgi:hypothetical protein
MDDQPSEAPATAITPAAVTRPAAFDPVLELERLRALERSRRRVVLAIGAGFVFLFVLSLVQFLGTLTACKLLYEARRESARVHRETAQFMEELSAVETPDTDVALDGSKTRRCLGDGTGRTALAPRMRFPDGTGDPSLMKRDVPADGGLLVGFRVGVGREENTSSTYVASLQPIYLTAQGETLGVLRGKEPSLVIHYRAKPGYAVGAVLVQERNQRFHMRLRYLHIGARQLEIGDAYQDEWTEQIDGKEPVQLLGGDGVPVVGVLVAEGRDGAVSGLGLVRVKPGEDAKPADEASSDLDALLDEIRKAIKDNRLTP